MSRHVSFARVTDRPVRLQVPFCDWRVNDDDLGAAGRWLCGARTDPWPKSLRAVMAALGLCRFGSTGARPMSQYCASVLQRPVSGWVSLLVSASVDASLRASEAPSRAFQRASDGPAYVCDMCIRLPACTSVTSALAPDAILYCGQRNPGLVLYCRLGNPWVVDRCVTKQLRNAVSLNCLTYPR